MKMTSKFSYRFSGISVWLEPAPDESSQIITEMEYLRERCGGSEAGLYAFVPHCTLLYNTSLHPQDGSCHETTTIQQQAESMLRQCLKEYHTQAVDIFNDEQTLHNNRKQLQLIPTSQYYFPYPKTADNGKGFGCCISLLILETTPQLKLLHDVVRNRFPPDERHGDDGNDSDDDGNNINNNNEGVDEPRFRPHMALVYAPEDQENVTNGFLKRYTEQNEEEKRYETWLPGGEIDQSINGNSGIEASSVGWNAKYLSLWSTEGTLDDWYPIFKLDLEEATLV